MAFPPIAVSPGTLGPGLYLTIDLLAGAAGPGVDELKVLMIAPIIGAGAVDGKLDVANFEIRRGEGEDSAGVAYGVGGSGHLAAKRLYGKAKGAIVDFMGYVAAGGAPAELELEFAGEPTGTQIVDVDISGRKFSVTWPVAMTGEDFVAVLEAAIVSRTNDLPMTAVAGADGLITFTSKEEATTGNDIIGSIKLRNAQTNDEAITGPDVDGSFSLVDGAGTPDLAPLLSIVDATEYAFILPILSNEDAQTDILAQVVDHIDNHDQGLNAKLQQFVIGFTGTVAQAKAIAVSSDGAKNQTFGEIVCCEDGRSLPGEFAAREVGGWINALPIDPAVNRIGEIFDGIYGAADVQASTPTESKIEDALGNGVALISYNAQGLPILVRPVVTHCQDSLGNPDRRLLDAQMVSATYIVARDLRNALPLEFPNAKITPDIAPSDDPPPKGVIEERDIKAFIISRLRFWQDEGVITKASLDASIADGSLYVKVNSSDASQVDIVLPFKIVPPLAKFGMVVQRQPN